MGKYDESIDVLNSLSDRALSKRESFAQQFLFVSSTLLGIVVSLHSPNSPLLYIRLVYVTALVLLSLGVMATLIVVFDFLQIRLGLHQDYRNELSSAAQKDQSVQAVKKDFRKRTLICQKLSLIFFVFGVLVLTSYSILISI